MKDQAVRNRLRTSWLSLLLAIVLVSGSIRVGAQLDSGRLDFSDFIALVKEHHPVAMQANLQQEKGNAQFLEARGNFDPELFNQVSQKYYDGTQYYHLLHGGLKVPTWFGIEFETGYTNSDGYYLNPQNRLPESGLFYASLSVPIGKDLFIDKRMAEYQKGKIYQQAGTIERQMMLNDLVFDAGLSYWNWFLAYNKRLIIMEAYDVAVERFEGIKLSAILGDRPIYDTLEASIQMQNRWLLLSQSEVELRHAMADLSTYLWHQGEVPLELTDSVRPPHYHELAISNQPAWNQAQLDSLILQNPTIQLYQNKLELTEIQKRYMIEQFKPELDLKYQAFSAPLNSGPLINYSVENYAWGLQFSFPILLREERGNLQLVKIQEQELVYQLELKQNQVQQKVDAYWYEWETTLTQVDLYRQTVNSYEKLTNGERALFYAGESTLFMVNSRETDYLNSLIKLTEIMQKNQKARLSLSYCLGNLYSNL